MVIDAQIGWPEGIWIALMVLRLLVVASRDGERFRDTHSFPLALMSVALFAALLAWGGFFS